MTTATDTEKQPATTRLTLDRRRVIDLIGENGFIIIFILWCLYLSITTPTFRTGTNLILVLRQSAIVGVVAIGETMVVLLGGIDALLAAILGITAVATAWSMVNGISLFGSQPVLLSAFPAAILGLAVGGFFGLINGLLVTRVKINSVI